MALVRINSMVIYALVISNCIMIVNLFYRTYFTAEQQNVHQSRNAKTHATGHSSGETSEGGTTLFAEKLKNMTFGIADHKKFVETVEFMLYDMSKSLPENSTNEIECIQLRNATPPYHVCLHDSNVDIYLSKHLRTAFVWEPHIQDLIKSFFEEYPDAFYFDLGMNIGTHALYAANLNTNVKVLAVEPFPKNVLRAHKAARLNKVDDRIKVSPPMPR